MEENTEFTRVINNKTTRFINTYLNTNTLVQQAGNDEFDGESIAYRITTGLKEYSKDQYKTVFLNQILTFFVDIKGKALSSGQLGNLGYGSFPNEEPLIEKTLALIDEVIFEVVQQLETLGINFNQESFSSDEYQKITEILNCILNELEIIKAGNSIIGDEIEDLENDLKDLRSSIVMGKRPFYQRATGIVASYIATKGADEVFDKIKPLIFELLKGFLKQNNIENIAKLIQ